jgi:hypothetical protein
MSKFLIFCAALLCLSISAAAQESIGALDTGSTASEPATPASLSPVDREAWQLGIGFQYQHHDAYSGFHTLGYNVDLTRYLAQWFGVEGTAVFGFGSTGGKPDLDAKSLFFGGGPHIALGNNSHVEPFVHVIAGWERFRFTQTNTMGADSALAFYAGGGVDYKFGSRASWRFQGDFIGSHFGNSINKNYSFGTGLIFNF